ncbi:MAG: RNA polymerase sigma-54 factor [Planctomycetes bacterium]|jgi:RNA polymerase sigma-54 factor|nr:RNA polymerase sigma-54 factor [Planctomycetota bacterium]
MIQAMKILQLPALDLEARIQQELDENIMLERREEETAAAEAAPAAPEESAEFTERDAIDKMLEDLERLDRDYGDGSRVTGSGGAEDADRKLAAMQNAPDVPKSMAEALTEELAFLDLTLRQRSIAEYLVCSLDERGYLREDLEDLAAACPLEPIEDSDTPTDPIGVEEVLEVLTLLRELVHPGLGARDLRETLLLQIDSLDLSTPLPRTIVAGHLDDLERNRLPHIAHETGASIEQVKSAIETLKTLDATPGADYGESRASVIHPDVIAEDLDGEFVVRLDRERQPRLTLSRAYRELLKNADKGDDVESWLKKRLESARWFIDALAQRQSTLERVARVVLTHQRPFFEKGLTALQPLRMQEVADEIGVHISTVSRAVSGKYAQTQRGIFPLKFFFSGGTTADTGEVTSQGSIQERIRELIESEDKQKPLSDEAIAKRLQEDKGISIARRTVTKYRKMMSVPSSSQRRTY